MALWLAGLVFLRQELCMHSMTGFGCGEAVVNGVVWRVEIQTVNRKQLEVLIQLPRELNEHETNLRQLVTSRLSRGRVQVHIGRDKSSAGDSVLKVNQHLAQQYVTALQQLSGLLPESNPLQVSHMVSWPGVFSLEQSSTESEVLISALQPALESALEQLLAMRQREGLNLQQDIEQRLSYLETCLNEAEAMAPQVVERLREALMKRLEEADLGLALDDERLLKELALYADRCDTSEELIRARSHIQQFRVYMQSGEAVGRALDFLSQELFREFNTMGSKANHAPLAQLVVRSKTELEKIREQVQNLE